MTRSAPGSSAALDDLFERNHRDSDLDARDQLIERFRPLATQLARRYRHPNGEPFEDLLQVATLGLIKAVDRFDPTKGFAFASFATPTILGELRRHFRDATWAVHLPRNLQEDVLLVEKATGELAGHLGRSPSVSELAERTELDEDAVLEALAAGRSAQPRSLDAATSGDADEDMTLGERQGVDEPGFEVVEYGASVAGTMRELSERDRLILSLRFVEGLTQAEIAERVDLSQMQISRILTRTLRDLRDAAGEPTGDAS